MQIITMERRKSVSQQKREFAIHIIQIATPNDQPIHANHYHEAAQIRVSAVT